MKDISPKYILQKTAKEFIVERNLKDEKNVKALNQKSNLNKYHKKAFLSDQCKEMEENNKMGKTRDLFKKSRDNQGNISCKNGLNKGQKLYGPNSIRRY